MNSANDYLKEYNCTQNFYRHNFGILYTDGIKAMCDKFDCYWLLDVIVSYQPILRHANLQIWKLKKTGKGKAVVTCDNGYGKILKQQNIPYTDFEPETATIWVEGTIVLLPTEH